MEDVSRLVGNVTVSWLGNDYILKPATIETWGTLQSHLIEEKRSRMIAAVLRLKGKIPDQDFADLKKDAINEAGNVNALSTRDMSELMSTEDGSVLLWWVLFEQSYPRTFSRQQVREMIVGDAITEEMGLKIARQLELAFGVGKSGNSDGQTE